VTRHRHLFLLLAATISAPSAAQPSEAYSALRVFSLDWASLTMHNPRIDEIKADAVYRMESTNKNFVLAFIRWLRLDELTKCNVPQESRGNRLLVIELEQGSIATSLVSDGRYLYDEKMARCRDTGADFKNAFAFGSDSDRMN